MSVSTYELMTVSGDDITADLIVWRRYKCFARGIVELMLDANPHLATIHRDGPFIPPGTQVRIPIDTAILKGAPTAKASVSLWPDNPRL